MIHMHIYVHIHVHIDIRIHVHIHNMTIRHVREALIRLGGLGIGI